MDNISSRMARPLMKPETSSFQENRKDPRKERSYNSYYDVYVKKMAAKLIEEKDRRVRISPFEEQWLGGNWRMVDEKEMFPVVSVDGSRLIKQYGHFIFAFNDEYLLLGVPGGNDAEERPDDGA